MKATAHTIGLVLVASFVHICYAEPGFPFIRDINSHVIEPIKTLLYTGPSLIKTIATIKEAEFMNLYKKGELDPDVNLNLTQLVKKYGYDVETHFVETEDGYIIAAYRIPGKGEPVLIVHGIVSSAVDWLTMGPNTSLPYLLAERGYDVWLISYRGATLESRGHVSISADANSEQYWDFSWDEIGRYDIAAAIDFILNKTGHKTLKYVGHSQGNTVFLVLMSMRPEYNEKVSLATLLSPVSILENAVSPILKLVSPLVESDLVVSGLKGLNIYYINADHPIVRLLAERICGTSAVGKILCSSGMFVAAGFNPSQLDVSKLPVIYSHAIASVSIKQLLHYGQELNSGKFRRYDYGRLENMKKYGTAEPPEYPLEKISAPLAILHTDDNDWLCAKKDANTLISRVKTALHTKYIVPLSSFCHTDFLYAKDVKELVYDQVLELIKK